MIAVLQAAPAEASIVWNVDWVLVLTFVVSTVLPLLVAIVSTKLTSGVTKGILLAALAFLTSIASGLLEVLTEGGVYDVGEQLLTFGGVFAWSVVSYFGIWRAKTGEGQESIADKLTANVGRTVSLDRGDDGTYRRSA